MKTLPSRTSPRRSEYNYTDSGAYFVTICTAGMQYYFWEAVDGEMRLNEVGKICKQQIRHIEQSRPYVEIHASIIMPNHVHVLLIMWSKQPSSDCRGGSIIRPIDTDTEIIYPMYDDKEEGLWCDDKEEGLWCDEKEDGIINMGLD